MCVRACVCACVRVYVCVCVCLYEYTYICFLSYIHMYAIIGAPRLLQAIAKDNVIPFLDIFKARLNTDHIK